MKRIGMSVFAILAGALIPSAPAVSARLQERLLRRLVPVAPPQDHEVCFSPEGPCDEKLRLFVASAKKSLDIAVFDLNLEGLVHQIALLSKTLKVRVVVDVRQSKGRYSLVSTLLKAGVPVRYGSQRGLMHHKFSIVDGRRIETGSFNYTHHASSANHENQLYLAEPEIVATYQRHFNELWDHARIIEPAE